jgi:hypothetical protein
MVKNLERNNELKRGVYEKEIGLYIHFSGDGKFDPGFT